MANEKEHGNIILKRIYESEYPCEKVSLTSDKDNQKYPIHSIVLVAASKYFAAALGPNFQEGKKDEFVLERTNGATVKAIVDFCYTGHINLTEKNVEKFLAIASGVAIDLLEAKCRQFLNDNLRVENALRTLAAADKYSYADLRQYALELVRDNFNMVSASEFRNIDQRLLQNLLESGEIKAPEELVFSRLFEWFLNKEEERNVFMPDLLKLIRLDRITLQVDCIGTLMVADKYKYAELRERALNIVCGRFEALRSEAIRELDPLMLRQVLQSDCINATEECVFNRLLEWFKHEEDGRWRYMHKLLKLIRLEHMTLQFLNDTISEVYTTFQCSKRVMVEFKRRALSPHLKIDVRRSRSIYCVFEQMRGEEDENEGEPAVEYSAAKIERYNNVLNTFEEAVEITLETRTYFNTVLQKNKLFVLGGRMRIEREAASYDLITRQETVLPKMSLPREDCIPIPFGKDIYVLGGWHDTTMNSCERFDTKKNEWEKIEAMNVARFCASATILNGYIYVAGGRGLGNNKTNSAELYDPKYDEWINIASMKLARSNFALIEFNGFLYAMGGNEDEDGIEKYDPWKNCWLELGSFDESGLIVSGINVNGQIFVITKSGKFGEIKIDDRDNCTFIPMGESNYQPGSSRRRLAYLH